MSVSIVVVLPAPLRPTSTTDSPASTRSDTPRSTWTGPRYASMRSTCSIRSARDRGFAARMGADECGRDGVVTADLVRRAVGEDRPLVHDDDALGIAEHDVHVVLDDDDRDAARAHDRAHDVHDRRLLAGGHAARGLV